MDAQLKEMKDLLKAQGEEMKRRDEQYAKQLQSMRLKVDYLSKQQGYVKPDGSSSSRSTASPDGKDKFKMLKRISIGPFALSISKKDTQSKAATDPLSANGIKFGFLPDDSSGGGNKESMAQIISALNGARPATYGYYSQCVSGIPYDGSQLLGIIDDVKASGAIFEPAVMPTQGWQGLTANDNSQAVNIAKVMKQFTDQGIQVRLRFAHEVNYYQTDGTYAGGVDDFKAGWAAVAAACRKYAPDVKMFFTPNIADLGTYDEYFPDDISTVDYIGIDYYPRQLQSGDFVSQMKPFHDKYCSANGPKFAIGETGLGFSADINTRISWAKQITSQDTVQNMPYFESCTWFNYQKGYSFQLVVPGGDNSAVDAFFGISS